MSEPAGETSSGNPQASPYRPPPIVDESSDEPPEPTRRPHVPIWFVAVYSFGAAILSTAAAIWAEDNYDHLVAVAVAAPLLFLGSFTRIAMVVVASQPGAIAKSAAWKWAMAVTSAPVALTVFVPTCLAVIVPVGFAGFIGVFLALFVAFFVTCWVIGNFVQSKFAPLWYRSPAAQRGDDGE